MRPSSARSAVNVRPQSALTDPSTQGTRVQVAVRVRPLNRSDAADDAIVILSDPVDPCSIVIDDNRRGRTFSFDHVFFGNQTEVYNGVGKPLLQEAYKGFNTCLFAYGQTGSGKTYSIQGEPNRGDEHGGLLHHLVREMFRTAQTQVDEDSELTIKVTMSYLEVYMERVRDLLVTRARGQEAESLELHDDKNRKVFVKGLSIHPVLGVDRVEELLALGNVNRQTAETKMNEVSSRSHSIVQFTITQLHEAVDRRDVESVISIVDLAGSERQGKSEASGLQFEEAKKINQSLLTLGRALHAFSDGRGEMVSLRESKLTRLLSESFGGNSKTWMLATVSPACIHLTESLSTLEYATHAKNITNRATINKMARHLELIELREVVERLESTVSDRRDALKELQQVNAQIAAENAELRRVAADREACEQTTALDNLLQKEIEANHRLRNFIRMLRDAQSSTADTVVPQLQSKTCFTGHAAVDLTNIFLGKRRSFTLPLESPTHTGAVLSVDLYPVDSAGRPMFDSLSKENVTDIVGHSVRWEVLLRDLRAAPSRSRLAQCRLSFRFDSECCYNTPEVPASPDATFNYTKRFHLPNVSSTVAHYCTENEVLLFEVLCSE